jgi:hypothetical protein
MDCRDREAETGPWYDRFDHEKMILVVELYNEDTEEDEEVEFPARYEVCGLCDGHGKHVNPSIDAHGISAEEFYEDPDFREEYFAGTYDVACYRCHGDRVEPVVDETRCDKDKIKRLHDHMKARADEARERYYERRMGC